MAQRGLHATFWAGGGSCRDLTARMMLSDALALDTTLDQLAAALAAQGDDEQSSLQVVAQLMQWPLALLIVTAAGSLTLRHVAKFKRGA